MRPDRPNGDATRFLIGVSIGNPGMRMQKAIQISLTVAALAVANVATAQDEDDWDYGRSDEQNASVAAVTFDTMGVAVRCMNGTLSVLLSGMPAGSGERTVRVAVGDGGESESSWVSARNSGTLFAVWPRALAQDLAAGGRLNVAIPDSDRIVRYAVDIPASESSIPRVFEACGRPFVESDSHDFTGVSMGGLEWVTRPEIDFPDQSRYADGIAALICTTQANGHLGDCSVESEFPPGSGFGRASALGAHRTGRVQSVGGGNAGVEGRRIAFVTRFGISNAPPLGIPTRLPRGE